MTQGDLDFAHARNADPETSHEAAASVLNLTERREAILKILQAHPEGLTDEEIERQYNRLGCPAQSQSGLRTRRSELVRMGLVEDSGGRGPTRFRRMSIVWRAR